MKKILLIMSIMGLVSSSFAQQTIQGDWNGILSVQGMQLRLVFHVSTTEEGYTATLDSPDQGANGIPVNEVISTNDSITFKMNMLNASYAGIVNTNQTISGTFTQNGFSIPLELSRKTQPKKELHRPQEPKPPFPYNTEEVTFNNTEDHVQLSGTLSFPSKGSNFPAVVLISGSGPQNRDEEILEHKPFLVIADYLTRNGIAVLRYDDRGTAKSTGDFKQATSFDFKKDVDAAVAYLKTRKEINADQIGLIGHSEGGLIAPMVAADNKSVAFIVLLAGPGVKGKDLLLKQQDLIWKAAGMDDSLRTAKLASNQKALQIIAETKPAQLQETLREFLEKEVAEQDVPPGKTKEEAIAEEVFRSTRPWFVTFIKYDPSVSLQKVSCPVLAINGEKDLQVSPKENLEGIKKALVKGGNHRITIKELPGLNHLFQEAQTGAPSEYGQLEQTFSPTALVYITTWIQKQVD